MRRGLVLAGLIVVALAGFPAAASADPADPVAHIDPSLDGLVLPQGAPWTFGFWCTSETSFVVSCVGSQSLGSQLETAQAGPHTVSVTATDYEGRQATATATYTIWDMTPPHVVFRVPADGATYEQGAQLFYDFSCEDDVFGLGILECGSQLMPFPMPDYPLDTHHLGTFTFNAYAVDRQFNIKQQSVTYTIVDSTPPAITFSSPADGATYTIGQQVWALFGCDDGPYGSGMNGCKGDAPSGTQLDTSFPGTRTFTVNAYDRAGNTAHEVHTYSVVYDFAGFASPAAPYPSASVMKAGESVPLKFSLHGDQGSNIFAAGSPGWIPCGALDGPSQAAGALSYNASSDRYTFLATTAKSWAGSCRDLVATLRDGTTHRARFSFTK